MEYLLYCDESVGKDLKYCDFFGGCIISSKDLIQVTSSLEQLKTANNLLGEIKWTKVTDQYLEKYSSVLRLFFRFVREGKIRVRIMFRSAEDASVYARSEGRDDKYFKLYYQFIKHAFGFAHTDGMEPFYVRIYLDQLPTKASACSDFKNYLRALPETRDFQHSAMRIREDQIAEVRSHEHVLLQCTDIVLGAMQFRLNHHHKDIPEGKKRRGKRTVAKEKLYNVIRDEICTIHPNFR